LKITTLKCHGGKPPGGKSSVSQFLYGKASIIAIESFTKESVRDNSDRDRVLLTRDNSDDLRTFIRSEREKLIPLWMTLNCG